MTLAELLARLDVAGDGSPPFKLQELPGDALARIIERLSIRDILSLCQASWALNSALQDERVWHGLATTTWSRFTKLHRWVSAPTPLPGTPSRAALPSPATYRELYILLHEAAPIVGMWRLVGEGPRGALISFHWTQDGIEGVEMEPCSPLTGQASVHLWARICPARGLNCSVAVDGDGENATVTLYGTEHRMHRSPSAEAAASVALPHAQASSFGLASSPQGSFEYEWLTFMASNVKSGRSRQRRRSQRGTCAARPEGPTVYHLKRVPHLLQPSSKHPFGGLWAADYGSQGLEVLQLHYDFRGKAAQLRGSKITGDECVPAGQCSWHCAAAALPLPWDAADQQLVEQQEERWQQESEWWADGEEEEDGGGTSNKPSRVVAIHGGCGQVAGPGFMHPEWVAGRLLVFADGRLCFAWLEGLQQVIDMRRLSTSTASA